jgi:hypothetical protein
VAVDWNGYVFTYDGTSWSSSPASIDPDDGLSSVSCPTTGFCVAVENSGNALPYDGSTWSSPASIDDSGGGLTSVSCTTAGSCAAVDQHGNVFTHQAPAATHLVFSSSPAVVRPGARGASSHPWPPSLALTRATRTG